MKVPAIFLALLLAGGATWGYLVWCDAARMAAFSKIENSKPALTVTQVESLLGRPAQIDAAETTGVTGRVYRYPHHGSTMEIVFVNGTVFTTSFLPGKQKS